MRFTAPYLACLILIPFLLIFFYLLVNRRITKALKAWAAPEILNKIIDPATARYRRQRWILRITGLFFLVLALVGPQWGYRWQEKTSRGLEIIFALDTSKSMLASDVKPNRFDQSKLAIKDFIPKLNGNRVGLIAFAGSSFIQCPLTLDYSAFRIVLDGLSIQSIPRGGTAIGAAIANARQAFKSANGSKILILITDGENHEGDPIPEAQKAAQAGINIYTIGIGSPEGVQIELKDTNGNTVYLKDNKGNPVKTSLNEAILKSVAMAGKGSYTKADQFSMGLDELYQTQLLKYYQSELKSEKQRQYIDRYQIPLLIALLIFLMELAISFHLKVRVGNFIRNIKAS